MAFRRSIMNFKNFAVSVFEHLGLNLTAVNYQKEKVYDLSKSLSLLCSGTHSPVEGIQSCTPKHTKGNFSLMHSISPNIKFHKESHIMFNGIKQQSCNSGWFSGFLTTDLLNPSHRIRAFSVSRNFTTLASNKSKTVVLHASITEASIKCSRMKHSQPKVPPTRMMSVYDLERTITDEEAAKDFVYALKAGERKCLYEELARFHGDTTVLSSTANEPPTRQQLKLVTLHQMFPFIGFGFLDNFLMIVAGEYIDMKLGVTLGISTMAAAALGNWFSDVCGLGSAHYVETVVTRFGIRHPHLSPAQIDMKSTKWASNFGKVIGITIGCFLGMIPLLFFRTGKSKEETDKEKEISGTSEQHK